MIDFQLATVNLKANGGMDMLDNPLQLSMTLTALAQAIYLKFGEIDTPAQENIKEELSVYSINP